MSDISPTRTNLLARRSQLGLAAKGVDLLQKKRASSWTPPRARRTAPWFWPTPSTGGRRC